VPAASCMIPGWPMYGSGLVLDSKWYQMPYQVPCKYDLSAVESTSTNANYRILFWYQVVHVTTTWFDTRRSNAAVSFVRSKASPAYTSLLFLLFGKGESIAIVLRPFDDRLDLTLDDRMPPFLFFKQSLSCLHIVVVFPFLEMPSCCVLCFSCLFFQKGESIVIVFLLGVHHPSTLFPPKILYLSFFFSRKLWIVWTPSPLLLVAILLESRCPKVMSDPIPPTARTCMALGHSMIPPIFCPMDPITGSRVPMQLERCR